MDERAIVADGKLIVGSVRAVEGFSHRPRRSELGQRRARGPRPRRGTTEHVVLDQHFEQDDHDGPALLAPARRPHPGRLHPARGRTQSVLPHLRAEQSARLGTDPGDRNARRRQPAVHRRATSPTRICSSLKSGRIYNFYRGFDYDPNYMFSDDHGQTWQLGGRLLQGPRRLRPILPSTRSTATTPSISSPPKTIPATSTTACTTASSATAQVYRSDGTPLGPLSDEHRHAELPPGT